MREEDIRASSPLLFPPMRWKEKEPGQPPGPTKNVYRKSDGRIEGGEFTLPVMWVYAAGESKVLFFLVPSPPPFPWGYVVR